MRGTSLELQPATYDDVEHLGDGNTSDKKVAMDFLIKFRKRL